MKKASTLFWKEKWWCWNKTSIYYRRSTV